MPMTVADFKTHLTGMLHGGTLKKVRNFEFAMQRAANTMLTHIDPIDTERSLPLTSTIHDNEFTYALPADFKKIIDIYPQNIRTTWDTANRMTAERFDLRKSLVDKTISIEGLEGTKVIRINWKTRQPKTINSLNSLTANGIWAGVGTATNVLLDTVDYTSANGSIKFDLVTTGDGIKNTTMTPVDLTLESKVGDFLIDFKIKNAADLAALTSIGFIWGNDLTAKYWTGVAQTLRTDGLAFQLGWNQILVPWSTATQTGTVDPSKIDSLQLTVNATAPITQIHFDNVTCAIGSNFQIKQYSKYILKNAAGTWIARTADDSDIIVLDDDCIQIYTLETLIACAQQMEGIDSSSDIGYATTLLYGPAMRRGYMTFQTGLYSLYRAEHPSQSKKAINSYGTPTMRRFNRGNFGISRFC